MPSILSASLRPRPLAELSSWIGRSLTRYRGLRLWTAVARESVSAQICAECIAESRVLSATAHSAEVHDREALGLLDRVLADGRLSADELPALARARALIARSAAEDHELSERTHLPA